MQNFNRKYILRIGPAGKQGVEINSLHISFSFDKADTESNNSGKVTLWNLSPSTLAILDKKDCVVELKAGYQDGISLIFVGNVTDVVTQQDGSDTMTEFQVVDGRLAVRDTYISLSFNKLVKGITIVDSISKKMGLTVRYSAKAKDTLLSKTLKKGFSFVGSGKNGLKKICTLCKLKWSIQNGILQISSPGEAISNRVYVLSAESGLLGIPKRVTISESNSEGKESNKTGYEITYFMNGNIGIADFVKLESKKVNGVYFVQKINYTGDNMEGEWTCTATIVEAKQSKKKETVKKAEVKKK